MADQLLVDLLGPAGAAAVARAVAARPGLAGAVRPRAALAWAEAALARGFRGAMPGRPDLVADVVKGEGWAYLGGEEEGEGASAPALAAHVLARAGGDPGATRPDRALLRLGQSLEQLVGAELAKAEPRRRRIKSYLRRPTAKPLAKAAPKPAGAHAGIEAPGPAAAARPPKPPTAPQAPTAPSNAAGKLAVAKPAAAPGAKPAAVAAKPPKPPTMKAEGERSEPLEKRSKNVRQHLAAVDPPTRERRVQGYLERLGLRPVRIPYDDQGRPPQFGQESPTAVQHWGHGALTHEAAHAMMTPVGQTLAGRQEDIGRSAGTARISPEEAQADEQRTLGIAPGLYRRAGARPPAPTGIHHPSKQQAVRGYQAHTAPVRAEGKAVLEAFDDGRRRIEPSGQAVAGTSPDARINARAQKAEGAPQAPLEKAGKVIALPGAAAAPPTQPDRKAGGKKVVNILSRLGVGQPGEQEPEEEPLLPSRADDEVDAGHDKHLAGDLQGALKHYDRAVWAAPNHATAHYNRGVVLEDLGQHDEAINAYGEALRHDPTMADAHHNIAGLLAQSGVPGEQHLAAGHMQDYHRLSQPAAPAPTPRPAPQAVSGTGGPPPGMPEPQPRQTFKPQIVKSEGVRLTKAELRRPCGACGHPQVQGEDLIGCGCHADILAKAEIAQTSDGFAVRFADREELTAFVGSVRDGR